MKTTPDHPTGEKFIISGETISTLSLNLPLDSELLGAHHFDTSYKSAGIIFKVTLVDAQE